MLAPQPVSLLYKGAILLGLLVSTLAVVFYHVPKTPVYVAVAHFYIVYFVYFIAFVVGQPLSPSLPPSSCSSLPTPPSLFWLQRSALREAQGALLPATSW